MTIWHGLAAHLHEYQARELLAQFGIPVPPAIVVDTADEAAKAYETLAKEHSAALAVVKAQVHATGYCVGSGIRKMQL